MANKIMNLIPNGVIIQGLNTPTDFMTKVKYSGVNAYYHNPLSQIKDSDCKSISGEVFHKECDDGCYQILEFISDKDLFIRYVNLCKKHNVPIRALFIESEYAFEHWTEDKPACKFIGYEYCEIPFDSQIITDFSWYTPLHCFLNKLNSYGLFDSIDEAKAFKKKYDEEFDKGNIGDGEMDTFICRVSEIDLTLL